MIKFIMTSLLFILTITLSSAQSKSETKYYNDKFLSKELPKEKARFSETKTINSDGSITNEIKKIKSGDIISRKTYKGKEPFGIWLIETGSGTIELDYNFTLNYTDTACIDILKDYKIKNYLEDDDSISYKAPKIDITDPGTNSGEDLLIKFLKNEIVYPIDALESGISGTVYLNFNITNEGKVENIAIKKGCNIYLDKEAVRVIKKLKFLNSALLKGKPINLCFRLPIKFTLS